MRRKGSESDEMLGNPFTRFLDIPSTLVKNVDDLRRLVFGRVRERSVDVGSMYITLDIPVHTVLDMYHMYIALNCSC